MTATTTPALPGFGDAEDDARDGLADVYWHLTDDHRVVTCGCGRDLLVATLPGEPYRGFRETEADPLPPLVFRWRAAGARRVPQCCPCYVAGRRANRRRGG